MITVTCSRMKRSYHKLEGESSLAGHLPLLVASSKERMSQYGPRRIRAVRECQYQVRTWDFKTCKTTTGCATMKTKFLNNNNRMSGPVPGIHLWIRVESSVESIEVKEVIVVLLSMRMVGPKQEVVKQVDPLLQV